MDKDTGQEPFSRKKTEYDWHRNRIRKNPKNARPKSFRDSKDNRSNFYQRDKQWLNLYGLHAVQAALENPRRIIRSLMASRNAFRKLGLNETSSFPFEIKIVEPSEIDKIAGKESTHQGVILETRPLETSSLEACKDFHLVLVLDQITDPRNTGAIIRSAVAFGANAIITTQRHGAPESASLAKAASGALEHIHYIRVQNIAKTLEELHWEGFHSIGLDSQAENTLEECIKGERLALILGGEGKGLRERVRKTVHMMGRISLPGKIHSLNVSNAAAIAMHVARKHIDR